MDWTWRWDGAVTTLVLAATAAGVVASLALAATVWAGPRRLRWLARPEGRAAAGALALLSWDGLYLSNGGLSFLVLMLAFVAQGLLVLGCAGLRRWGAARHHLHAALLWALVGVAVAGFSRLNLHLGRVRAESVIGACRRFEADRGRLPDALADLVPEYLPRVPRASWTALGAFHYDPAAPRTLSYYGPWPIERVYVFREARWYWRDDSRSSSAPEEKDVGPGDDPGQGLQALDLHRLEVALALAG